MHQRVLSLATLFNPTLCAYASSALLLHRAARFLCFDKLAQPCPAHQFQANPNAAVGHVMGHAGDSEPRVSS
jgi:hypothetical protein